MTAVAHSPTPASIDETVPRPGVTWAAVWELAWPWCLAVVLFVAGACVGLRGLQGMAYAQLEDERVAAALKALAAAAEADAAIGIALTQSTRVQAALAQAVDADRSLISAEVFGPDGRGLVNLDRGLVGQPVPPAWVQAAQAWQAQASPKPNVWHVQEGVDRVSGTSVRGPFDDALGQVVVVRRAVAPPTAPLAWWVLAAGLAMLACAVLMAAARHIARRLLVQTQGLFEQAAAQLLTRQRALHKAMQWLDEPKPEPAAAEHPTVRLTLAQASDAEMALQALLARGPGLAWPLVSAWLASIALACLALSIQPWAETRAAQERQAKAQAQQVSNGLADRIRSALALGMAVPEIPGVGAVFDAQLNDSPSVLGIRLVHSDGREVAPTRRDGLNPQADLASLGGEVRTTLALDTPAQAGASGWAVEVGYARPSRQALAWHWAGTLALGACVGLGVALLGWLVPWRRGVVPRLTALQRAARTLAASGVQARTAPPPNWRAPPHAVRHIDARLGWLVQRWRDWRDAHTRWMALAQSRLATQDDPVRQRHIAAALRVAQADEPATSHEEAAAVGTTILERLLWLLVPSVALVVVAATAAGYWRQSQAEQALNESLLTAFTQTQDRVFAAAQADAVAVAGALVSKPALRSALEGGDKEQTARALTQAMRELALPPSNQAQLSAIGTVSPGSFWRVDVYGAGFDFLATSAVELNPDPLLLSRDLSAWVEALSTQAGGPGTAAAARIRGVSHTRSGYWFVKAVPVGEAGWLVVGQPMARLLPELAKDDSQEAVALVNPRGSVAAASATVWANAELPANVVRSTGVRQVHWQGKPYRAVVLRNGHVNARGFSAVVSLRDQAAQVQQQRTTNLVLGGAAAAFVTLLLGLVAWQTTRFLKPLGRAVEALSQLAQGNLRAAVNDADEQAPGEAGAVARAVAPVRNKLLDLELAGQERERAAVRQAQLLGLRQELDIARRMQAAILPQTTPQRTEVQLASLMVPAKEVGGDFYDYFELPGNRLVVVMADVSGKGVPAALFMAISRTLLKALAQLDASPAVLMQRLNDQLAAENEQMMFVTVFLGVLHLQTGELQFVNAGHNPPVLIPHDNEPASFLPRGQNPALAVMDGVDFVDGSLQLEAGDTLVLYTDGVTEATNAEGALLGEVPLLATCEALRQQADLAQWPRAVLQTVRGFEAGAPQADDITCVALRYAGCANTN
jgi:serine phosphatase RsbU (regulator of sigma subunit)